MAGQVYTAWFHFGNFCQSSFSPAEKAKIFMLKKEAFSLTPCLLDSFCFSFPVMLGRRFFPKRQLCWVKILFSQTPPAQYSNLHSCGWFAVHRRDWQGWGHWGWGGKWGVGWMTATVAARSDAEMLPQILALFLQMRGFVALCLCTLYRQFSAP